MTERCNERFFEMPIGQYCGVFIRESAAKKLQKILYRQTQEIKDFLTRNLDSLEAADWTLAYIPDQVTVSYFDGNSRDEIENRIKVFDETDRLRYVPDVFRTDKTYVEAITEVRQFYEDHYGKKEVVPHDISEQ